MVASSTLMGLVLASAVPALAFERISIASTVKADTEVEVKIVNDLSDGSKSFDGGFTHFNVYLATTPPGWGTGPACLLVNGTKIDTTSVKVTIPADVVPDKTKLKISTVEYNEDPHKDGPSGFQYSRDFTLQGGKGSWGKSELAGSGMGDMDKIPCSAWACVRKCNDEGFDALSKFKESDSEDVEAYKRAFKPVYQCMTKCEGTTMMSWAQLLKQNGETDVDGESSSSSSSAGTASSTTTVTGTATVSATGTASTTVTASGTSTSGAAASTTTTTGGASARAMGGASGLALAVFVAACQLL